MVGFNLLFRVGKRFGAGLAREQALIVLLATISHGVGNPAILKPGKPVISLIESITQTSGENPLLLILIL